VRRLGAVFVPIAAVSVGMAGTPAHAAITSVSSGTLFCPDFTGSDPFNQNTEFDASQPYTSMDGINPSVYDWRLDEAIYWDGQQWQEAGWSSWMYRRRYSLDGNWINYDTGFPNETTKFYGTRGYTYAIQQFVYDGERGRWLPFTSFTYPWRQTAHNGGQYYCSLG